jgi:hypothetical protein
MEENKVATTTTSTTANITQSPPTQERPPTTGSLSNDNNSGSDNFSSGDDEAKAKKEEPTGTTPKERKTTQRWSAEEDEQLAELVTSFPSITWTELVENMTDHTARQCCERYTNSHKPNQKKGQWTEEEDSNIMKLQEKFGNQWSKIAT